MNAKAIKSVLDRGTIILLLISIIVISLVGTNTLANKVIKGETDNKVTSGEISTKLFNVTSDGSLMPEIIFSLLPGETIDNVVYAKNTCKFPEYVRIKLIPEITDNGEQLSTEHIFFNINSENWTLKDGYYYYNSVLEPEVNSIPLYDSIYIGTEIGNEYKTAEMTVNIELDAVQTANNSESALNATGWMQIVSPANLEWE